MLVYRYQSASQKFSSEELLKKVINAIKHQKEVTIQAVTKNDDLPCVMIWISYGRCHRLHIDYAFSDCADIATRTYWVAQIQQLYQHNHVQ